MKIIIDIWKYLLTKLLSVHIDQLFVLIVNLIASNISKLLLLKILYDPIMKLLSHWAFSRLKIHIDKNKQYEHSAINRDHTSWAISAIMKNEFCCIAKPSSESRLDNIVFEMSVPAFDFKSSVKHLVLLNEIFEFFNCLRFT